MLWKGRGWQTRRGTPIQKWRGCLSENYNQISCKTKKEKTNKAEILRQAETTAWFFLMINVEFIIYYHGRRLFSLHFAKSALKSLDHVVNALTVSSELKIHCTVQRFKINCFSSQTRSRFSFALTQQDWIFSFFFLKINKGHEYTKTNIQALFIKRKYNRLALRERSGIEGDRDNLNLVTT